MNQINNEYSRMWDTQYEKVEEEEEEKEEDFSEKEVLQIQKIQDSDEDDDDDDEEEDEVKHGKGVNSSEKMDKLLLSEKSK